MPTLDRFKTLYYLTLSPIRGDSHRERLESFYRGQADHYDPFRERLLHGRKELFETLPVTEHGTWIDLGAGTGRNAERFGRELARFDTVYLVDLSESLLKVARRRIVRHGWRNVHAQYADAAHLDIPDESVDLVTCVYSLTMMPEWFAVLDNAWRMLKPGGTIGVVDFYVAHKHPAVGRRSHSTLTRFFWPHWFAADNVFLGPDHLAALAHRFDVAQVDESFGKIPWLPMLRAPYYAFIGRKPATESASKLGAGPGEIVGREPIVVGKM